MIAMWIIRMYKKLSYCWDSWALQ